MINSAKESWGSGGPYERYAGRWIASEFLDWLSVSPGQAWGDVGCGAGALVAASSPSSRRNPSWQSTGLKASLLRHETESVMGKSAST